MIYLGKPSKNERRQRIGISESRFLLQLPKDLKNQIQAEAEREHLSLSGLIRLAVSEWLEEQRIIKQLGQGAVKRKTKVKLAGKLGKHALLSRKVLSWAKEKIIDTKSGDLINKVTDLDDSPGSFR